MDKQPSHKFEVFQDYYLKKEQSAIFEEIIWKHTFKILLSFDHQKMSDKNYYTFINLSLVSDLMIIDTSELSFYLREHLFFNFIFLD